MTVNICNRFVIFCNLHIRFKAGKALRKAAFPYFLTYHLTYLDYFVFLGIITLLVLFFFSIFAEDKLHSAIRKQVFIALICIIFAEDKLHSAIRKGTEKQLFS